MQFYPEDHPRVTEHTSELIDQVQELLSDNYKLVLAVDNNRLIIQDSPVEDNGLSDQLINTLEKRKIGSVVIDQGVTEEEIQTVLKLLTTPPEKLLDDEEIRPEFLDPLQNIKIDELKVQYNTSSQSAPMDTDQETDSEDDSSEDQTESDQAEEEDNSIFSQIESKSESLQDLLSADPDPEIIYDWMSELLSDLNINEEPEPVDTGFEAIMQLINKTIEKSKAEGCDLPDGPAREFLVQFLIKLGLMGDASFSSVKKKFGSHMSELEDEARNFLLGDAEPRDNPTDQLLDSAQPKARGLVIAREIRSGTASMDQLSQMMTSVAPAGDDVVDVTESAVEEMRHFTTMTEEKSSANELASLFNALLANTPYQDPSHQILIADDDVEYDQYLIYLSNLNYFFDLHEDGYDAWRAITSDNTFDLLILEIKIQGKTGLELIEDLSTLDKQPPVIVCTKYPQFRDAYEIVTYPEIEFLEKPVDEEEFYSAVNRLFPSTEEQKTQTPSLYSDEEMNRAKSIQNKLLSQPLPESERYTFSRFHASSPKIDGDYLDVIPINDEEHLLAMAEVSGNGVSASMVMVILRSTLHVLLNQLTEPRDMLIQMNRFISSEINRPMYAKVLLGRFNTAENTIQFAAAGKFAPLFWNQKANSVSSIDMSGISIGLTGDRRFDEYLETRSIALNDGDAVILHSSGVTEIQNESENSTFGSTRFQSIVQQTASDSAEAVTDQLREQLTQFAGETFSRDTSALVIKSS